MIDDAHGDDDAPELRKILDQMHGEEASVLSGMEEEREEVAEMATTNSRDGENATPAEEKQAGLSSDAAEPEAATAKSLYQSTATQQEAPQPSSAVEVPMSATAAPILATPPEHLKQDLEQLPVTLECAFRSISKTLSEVSQLRQGEIVPLGCSIDSPIQLKANGRLFAMGQLVLVDEQLCVEIIEKL